MDARGKFWLAVVLVVLAVAASLIVDSCVSTVNDPVGMRSAPVATNEGTRERMGLNTPVDSWFYNGADLLFFSDDHSTQKIALYGDSGNLDLEGDLDVAGSLDLTGVCTLTGGITLTESVIADSATITGTVSAADLVASDDLVIGDDATITGTLALGDLSVGGGYGATGCTVSAAGVLQCDGAGTLASLTAPALTVNGTGITMDSMVFTYTNPITITDVLTNVRLLFYQVP